jgi:hypothetical protein
MAAPLTDEQITKMAKARVSFKVHLMVYIAVNVFLAAVWYLTEGMSAVRVEGAGGTDYWPIWTHLGWGLGLAIHGFTVYGPANNMLAREEEKIRNEMGGKT